jgi:hypothetical protein
MRDAVETFFGAWSMADANAQKAAIAGCYAPDGEYADPRSSGVLSGVASIAEYVSMFSANAPGWTATVVKDDESGGAMRVTVAFGGMGPDGSEMVQHGQYFVEFNGDTISRMIGFVGTGAPE